MNRLFLTLALMATIGSLLASTPMVAQLVPPAKKAERVEITQGPSLEGARADFAIIRWTSTPDALRLRCEPAADCARYDRLRRAI